METAESRQENQKEPHQEITEPKLQELEKLQKEIEKLRIELEAEKNRSNELGKRMKYLQADIVNAQRQSERILSEARISSRVESGLELVSIKEDIERAIIASSETGRKNPIVDGLEMIITRIENSLQSQDIQLIRAERGKLLDPRFHEAVSFIEQDDANDGTIQKVVRDGYTIGGKVIRPSLVEVSRRKQTKGSEISDDQEAEHLEEVGPASSSNETEENESGEI